MRGYLHVDELTPDLNGAYAFDAKTGLLRWKWETRDHFHSIGDLVADDSAAYVWSKIEPTQLTETACWLLWTPPPESRSGRMPR